MLLVAVFGVFLLLIGLTASGVAVIGSTHQLASGLQAAVGRDAALVELLVRDHLTTDDVAVASPAAKRLADVDAALAAITHQDEILRIEIRDRSGAVRFSSGPAVAAPPESSTRLEAALRGEPSASLERGTVPDLAGPAQAADSVVAEYLPIQSDAGATRAAVILWRDAGPLLAAVGQAQRDIVLLVLGASAVLAVVLFLLFRAAQVRISRQQAQLVEATRRDPLTGLHNHGAGVALLAEMVEEARRTTAPLGIALLDVDNFRLFNETHGHAAGDAVLLSVAALAAGLEGGSVVSRYGPDEFLVAWQRTSVPEVEERVGVLRGLVAALEVEVAGGERLPVTVSAGVAVLPDHAASVTELLSEVAVALGEARASGGDAVRVARTAGDEDVVRGFDVLQGLVIAVDTKDRYTKRHSEDVARYAVFLATRLGLDEEQLRTIRLAGLLHDVGKIGIPDTLLRRPGKLTADEFEIFKQHVALGDAIVREVPNVEEVRRGIRHHHERWDGNGYLDGLGGEEIPLIGRILAVADAFSAMTTTRPYRKALPVEEAIKRLGEAAGSQLQEDLVVAFIAGMETAPDAPLPGVRTPGLWLPDARAA